MVAGGIGVIEEDESRAEGFEVVLLFEIEAPAAADKNNFRAGEGGCSFREGLAGFVVSSGVEGKRDDGEVRDGCGPGAVELGVVVVGKFGGVGWAARQVEGGVKGRDSTLGGIDGGGTEDVLPRGAGAVEEGSG